MEHGTDVFVVELIVIVVAKKKLKTKIIKKFGRK